MLETTHQDLFAWKDLKDAVHQLVELKLPENYQSKILLFQDAFKRLLIAKGFGHSLPCDLRFTVIPGKEHPYAAKFTLTGFHTGTEMFSNAVARCDGQIENFKA